MKFSILVSGCPASEVGPSSHSVPTLPFYSNTICKGSHIFFFSPTHSLLCIMLLTLYKGWAKVIQFDKMLIFWSTLEFSTAIRDSLYRPKPSSKSFLNPL